MNIYYSFSFYPELRNREIYKYFLFSVVCYCLTFVFAYLCNSHTKTLGLLVVMLVLFNSNIKKPLLFYLYNAIFLISLLASANSLANYPVFLIKQISISSEWAQLANFFIKREFLPLFIFSVTFIHLIPLKKRLDSNMKLVLMLTLLFVIICTLSSFVMGTSKTQLFYFVTRFTLMYFIIVFISTLNLSQKEIYFFLKYIIFTATFLQMIVLSVGWILPTLSGTFINADSWGGTFGRGSIRFTYLVSIGALYYFIKLSNNKLKVSKDWGLFFFMILMVLIPSAITVIIIFLITLCIISFIYNRTRIINVFIGIVIVFVFVFIMIDILPKNYKAFNMVYTTTQIGAKGVIGRGILKNPKIVAIAEVFDIYITKPGAFLIGVGPGNHFSGGNILFSYQGSLEDISGGATSKIFAFNNIYTETGLLGGTIFFGIFIFLMKLFYNNYRRYQHKLSFFGLSILIFLFLLSFAQESYENPSISLIVGVLLGLIYKDCKVNQQLKDKALQNIQH
jgi:hypothetical protein